MGRGGAKCILALRKRGIVSESGPYLAQIKKGGYVLSGLTYFNKKGTSGPPSKLLLQLTHKTQYSELLQETNSVFFLFINRLEAVAIGGKSHQELNLTTDIQWLKIHGKNWKKSTKKGTNKIKKKLSLKCL